jgi:hypothetical protein
MAESFLKAGNWQDTRAQILASNAFQTRTPTSALRIERELRKRLSALTRPQLALLATASMDVCTSLCWLALLKTTPFVLAFAADVLRQKLDSGDPILRRSDYENFFSSQIILHSRLGTLTASTQAKIRSVLLSMLRDTGILVPAGRENLIQRPVLSPEVLRTILAEDPRWLAGFLVPDTELASL